MRSRSNIHEYRHSQFSQIVWLFCRSFYKGLADNCIFLLWLFNKRNPDNEWPWKFSPFLKVTLHLRLLNTRSCNHILNGNKGHYPGQLLSWSIDSWFCTHRLAYYHIVGFLHKVASSFRILLTLRHIVFESQAWEKNGQPNKQRQIYWRLHGWKVEMPRKSDPERMIMKDIFSPSLRISSTDLGKGWTIWPLSRIFFTLYVCSFEIDKNC